MNWIVGGVKARIVSYPTHEVSTLQAEKCAISPFVEASSVRKQWKNAVKLAYRLVTDRMNNAPGNASYVWLQHFSKTMQHLRGV
jgi:hypothetical protein